MKATYQSLKCIGGTVRVNHDLIFDCSAPPLHERLNNLNIYPLKNRDDFPAVFLSKVCLKRATNPNAEPAEDFDDEDRYETDLGLRDLNKDETRSLLIRSVFETIVNGLPETVVVSWTGQVATYRGTWKKLKLTAK